MLILRLKTSPARLNHHLITLTPSSTLWIMLLYIVSCRMLLETGPILILFFKSKEISTSGQNPVIFFRLLLFQTRWSNIAAATIIFVILILHDIFCERSLRVSTLVSLRANNEQVLAVAYLKFKLFRQMRAATAMAQMWVAFLDLGCGVGYYLIIWSKSLSIIQSHLGMILVSLRNWQIIVTIIFMVYSCARLVQLNLAWSRS